MFGPFERAERAGVDAEHFFIEKDERLEGLVLRGGSHAAFGSEVIEIGADVFGTEVGRMTGIVEADVAFGPPDVGLFSAVGIPPAAAGGTDLPEEARAVRGGRG